MSRLGDRLDAITHCIENEVAHLLQPAVNVERSDERLVDRGDDGTRQRDSIAHALAQSNELVESEFGRDLGARVPAHHAGLDLGHVPFLEVGVGAEEVFADHQAKDRVAQELQTLVALEARISHRGVGQSAVQQRSVLELVTEHALRFRQAIRFLWLELFQNPTLPKGDFTGDSTRNRRRSSPCVGKALSIAWVLDGILGRSKATEKLGQDSSRSTRVHYNSKIGF